MEPERLILVTDESQLQVGMKLLLKGCDCEEEVHRFMLLNRSVEKHLCKNCKPICENCEWIGRDEVFWAGVPLSRCQIDGFVFWFFPPVIKTGDLFIVDVGLERSGDTIHRINKRNLNPVR